MTTFTKRDREFIMSLSKNIDRLHKRLDTHIKDDVRQISGSAKSTQKQMINKAVKEATTQPSYRSKQMPDIHAEFYKTDNKVHQERQVIFVESLEETLRQMCEANGIAYLSVEIDTRE